MYSKLNGRAKSRQRQALLRGAQQKGKRYQIQVVAKEIPVRYSEQNEAVKQWSWLLRGVASPSLETFQALLDKAPSN